MLILTVINIRAADNDRNISNLVHKNEEDILYLLTNEVEMTIRI